MIGSRYTTSAVKLRKTPSKDAKSVDIIDSAKKLKVTETVRKGYRLVVVDGKARWVTDDYLSKKKPSAEDAAGISNAPCSKSSGIESGLVANGVKVYRAICAAFPEVTSFGGRRGGGDFHGSGQAVDNMISDSTAGWRLANWLRANASKLGVSEVIYSQKIWTVQRSGEGWRGMSDRGSSTANHYDHVHVPSTERRQAGRADGRTARPCEGFDAHLVCWYGGCVPGGPRHDRRVGHRARPHRLRGGLRRSGRALGRAAPALKGWLGTAPSVARTSARCVVSRALRWSDSSPTCGDSGSRYHRRAPVRGRTSSATVSPTTGC